MNKATLKYFEAKADIIKTRKNQLLFSEGSRLGYLIYVVSGAVKLINDDGVVLQWKTEGSFIGASRMFSTSYRTAYSARARRGTVIMKLGLDDINASPPVKGDILARAAMEMVEDRKDAISTLAISNSKDKALAKIAKMLYKLSDKMCEDHIDGAVITASASEIAQQLGLKRETVGRAYNKLQGLGVIGFEEMKPVLHDEFIDYADRHGIDNAIKQWDVYV